LWYLSSDQLDSARRSAYSGLQLVHVPIWKEYVSIEVMEYAQVAIPSAIIVRDMSIESYDWAAA
jgi:hypothetical protein